MSRGPLVSPDRLKPDFGISIGNAQRKRLEAKGRFPKRVPVTERSHAYVLGKIQAYVQARLAARDDQAA